MRELKSLSLHCDGKTLKILDQTLLPGELKWIDATNPDVMIEAIHKLRVRGAPLIGIAAAICVALEAKRSGDEKRVRSVAQALRDSRPTAVNLMHCIDRMLSFAPGEMNPSALAETAEDIFLNDLQLCEAIGKNGNKIIDPNDNILTHCNTGGLATAGIGTAIGIIRYAHEQGKKVHVYVDETRPLLQGGRLTAWELGELKIPYTLICDNMAAILMQEKKVNKIIVGADRITANGDFANKVGTYNLAVLANHHNVPFYVAAPVTTLDTKLATGKEIPIENRNADEVRGVQGAFGKVTWSPADAEVFNPAFDVTPHDLVTGWILDTDVYNRPQIKDGILEKHFHIEVSMIAILGGSGFEKFEAFETIEKYDIETPFGKTSSGLKKVRIGKHECLFLSRHGEHHEKLPTEVNFRANIYAFRKLGAKALLSFSAVGSLREEFKPGDMVLPYQYIDRTKGVRAHTFLGDGLVGHVSLAKPICEKAAKVVEGLSGKYDFDTHFGQTYVCIEGPYFSTKAESNTYRQMGADIIGMTHFPEFALAREAGLSYIPCCFITDYDCWDDSRPHVTLEEVIKVMRLNNSKAFQMAQDLLAMGEKLYGDCECKEQGLKFGLMTPKDAIPKEKMQWLEVLLS